MPMMPRPCHAFHRSVLLTLAVSLLIFPGCSDQVEPLGDLDPDVPFAVIDLAIVARNDTTRLTWTATGDDGPVGTAARYDLRNHPKMLPIAFLTVVADIESVVGYDA